MTANEVRAKALDETKRGGDPQAAIALAVVYLGDVIASSDLSGDMSDALRTIGLEVGSLSVTR